MEEGGNRKQEHKDGEEEERGRGRGRGRGEEFHLLCALSSLLIGKTSHLASPPYPLRLRRWYLLV